MDCRESLERARKKTDGMERNGCAENIDAHLDLCCALAARANEILLQHSGRWEIASLAVEFLDVAKYLEEYEHVLNQLYSVMCTISDAVTEHPRLKLKVLRESLSLYHAIMCIRDNGYGGSAEDDYIENIALYENNIRYADSGEFDKIVGTGFIKTDPVEWSKEYEDIIDEAEKKIELMLADHPWGMGSCHAYWHAKRKVLSEDYNIEWNSPAAMNRHVMFD